MVTTIRNKLAQSLIIPVPGEAIVLSPRGDQSGADAMLVSDTTLDQVEIQNAMRRNLIEILSDEDIKRMEAQQDQARQEAAVEAQQAMDTSLTIKPNQDIIGRACIGPGARPSLECGQPVLSQAAKTGDQPPLCPKHEHLSGQFFQTEVMVEGADEATGTPGSVKVWKKTEVATPVVQHT